MSLPGTSSLPLPLPFSPSAAGAANTTLSFGTVHLTKTPNPAVNTQNTQKQTLHPPPSPPLPLPSPPQNPPLPRLFPRVISNTTPAISVPTTNPNGFPAEKHANARFRRFDGALYTEPNVPTAGVTAAAEKRPMSAVKMINVTPSGAKPQASVARVVNIIAVNASGFRPSVSESVPRGRTKAPFVSLRHPKHFHQYTAIENIQLKDGTWKVKVYMGATYKAALVIQTTSPCILRSRPMTSVMTVAIPEKMVDCAKAKVTVKTKRHSVIVLGKNFEGIFQDDLVSLSMSCVDGSSLLIGIAKLIC
ncbi:hypothetical protein BJX68DRAFT_163077 [Aspergillus pseudodeflectus]|uniref:Uncharacterized protein n=1 Tax=Aspergillus pseudodeflectus TaxID=176178 RepID=A0ABR4L125_9EURO